MQQLPIDVLRVVASFSTMEEFANMRVASREFNMHDIQRQKRFKWCKQNIENKGRILKQGNCLDCMCQRLKAVCITIGDEDFEEPRVQPLSNYCSQHARQYLGVDLNDLIYFVYVQ